MAKLYFRHGAMGSSKTANALMVEYNYYERGKKALLLKPGVDSRDGERVIKSRSGLSHSCSYVEEFVQMSDQEIRGYDCIIVDEAQFCTKSDIQFFLHVVDHLHIPVICYGLRTDFKRELFPGSMWLLAWADVIEEIRTVCWCGQGACCNARITDDGRVIRSGEQVVLGGNDSYIALCRKHYEEGNLGGIWKRIPARRTEDTPVIPKIESYEDDFDADEQIDPMLMEFLEADTYASKLDIFRRIKASADDEKINTIAMALDIEVAEGPIERRVHEVQSCLEMLVKYECNRLR